MSGTPSTIERTLGLIKPDAVNRAAEIEKTILEEGFTIVKVKGVKGAIGYLGGPYRAWFTIITEAIYFAVFMCRIKIVVQ